MPAANFGFLDHQCRLGGAFEIIEVPAQSAGEIVTKDELMNRVWPGAIVRDNTLQVHAGAVHGAPGPKRLSYTRGAPHHPLKYVTDRGGVVATLVLRLLCAILARAARNKRAGMSEGG